MTQLAPGEDRQHITYCRLCEAHCGILAGVEDAVITRILPDREHPVSKGHLWVKEPGRLKVT
ncbi:MAG: hypothetical protein AAF918_11330 [Pseudomonadota bacterium]